MQKACSCVCCLSCSCTGWYVTGHSKVLTAADSPSQCPLRGWREASKFRFTGTTGHKLCVAWEDVLLCTRGIWESKGLLML